jgi:hypothetical protein
MSYDVQIKTNGEEFTIRDVRSDGYIVVDGETLPIRWFLTMGNRRIELPVGPGMALSFGRERQEEVEARESGK